MHLLDTYALGCAAKISKPHIYTTFMPLPVSKYITFHSDEPEQSKHYDYIQDVINLIRPTMEQHGISILQIGNPNDRQYQECMRICGHTSSNQLAYVLQNSLLHFGPDGFAIHLASSFDVPLVGLYSAALTGVTKPVFGSPDKQILLCGKPKEGNKPSYSTEETPKTINNILPEEVASSILKLLGLTFELPFETVYCGPKYSQFIIEETIPNDSKILFNPEHQIEIRADVEYDEMSFLQQLGNYKKAVVVISRPVNIDILKRFSSNIHSIVFRILDDTQVDFLKKIIELGKQTILVSFLPQAEIDKLKSIYYEFGSIHKIEGISDEKIAELKQDIGRLFYRSAKIVANKGKYYYSLAAAERDIPMKNHHEYQRVIDTPLFWENAHCFTIVRIKSI